MGLQYNRCTVNYFLKLSSRSFFGRVRKKKTKLEPADNPGVALSFGRLFVDVGQALAEI